MNYAIIVAAGQGSRINKKINKIFLTLNDRPMIYYSILPFQKSVLVDKIILVANLNDVEEISVLINKYNFDKVNIVEGGEKRQDSVYFGIKSIKNAKNEDLLIIHNAANPFVSEDLLERVIKEAKDFGCVAVGIRAKDTIKEADENNLVIRTLKRERLWQMQTPQVIKYGLAVRAFVKAYNDNYYGTDDVELVERLGKNVKVVECSPENFKITYPSDLENARLLMNADRVGLGLDSHKFTDKPKQLVLGGILIPNEQGLEANSDGDVILHSLFNALSQSVGGKSLGFYADPLCEKGIRDSKAYLRIALDMINEKGFKINHIGIMVEAKKPRLDKYEELIKENIANLCGIGTNQVGLTVTSGEGLTPFGEGKAIQVFSIVSLRRKDES